MERIGRKSRNAREARAWERAQYKKMTLPERLRAALALKRRIYPEPQVDIREWHRKK